MTPELILGIESSCDETAAAVVRNGREILSSVVHTQIEEHRLYGGVVPEIAGRSHLRHILPVIDEALADANCDLDAIEGIAVTNRPGLIGSLLVGVSAAKSLAFTRDLPLVGVNHIEAHIYSATMATADPLFPCLALVVSGGHTSLYIARSPIEIERIASTLDDAAGEAFDKVAYMLGLPYPGGPSVSELALEGDPKAIRFPRYRPKNGMPGFSFSGLKTAVLYHLRGQNALAATPAPDEIPDRADVAASFEAAVCDNLTRPAIQAAQEHGLERILVSGGVACNRRLREVMSARAGEVGLSTYFPAPAYCTDNAAMIAGLGWEQLTAGQRANLTMDASPR